MACNNLQILNFTHTIVETGNNNTLVITDNNKCNSITIPQPVTNILQISSPGTQGPVGPSGSQGPSGSSVDTGSFATTGSNNFIGSQNILGNVTVTGSLTVSGSNTFTNIGPTIFSGSLIIANGQYITGSGIDGTGFEAAEISYYSSSMYGFVGIFPDYNYNTFYDGVNYNELQVYGDKVISLQKIEAPSFTGSLQGTSSFAITASYALNAGGSGFPFSGSAIITGSLLISGSGLTVTGSLRVTSGITGSLLGTASRATTASYALNGGVTSLSSGGSGIALSSTTGNITISNNGVTGITNGTGISINQGAGDVTIANDGVTSITAGSGISVNQSTGGVTISATGTGGNDGHYSIIFSQDSASDPNILKTITNTLDDGSVWSIRFVRQSAGIYRIYNSGSSKFVESYYVAVILSAGLAAEGQNWLIWYYVDDKTNDSIYVYSYNIADTALKDNAFISAFLDIKLYAKSTP